MMYKPDGRLPSLSVWPAVTIPVREYRCSSVSTKLNCSVAEAHVLNNCLLLESLRDSETAVC